MLKEQEYSTPPEVASMITKATGESWSPSEIRGLGKVRRGVIVTNSGHQLWPVTAVESLIEELTGEPEEEEAAACADDSCLCLDHDETTDETCDDDSCACVDHESENEDD
ncbi:MAG: hypothetical protein ACRELB_21930 [Polyangiaceae bacterium]